MKVVCERCGFASTFRYEDLDGEEKLSLLRTLLFKDGNGLLGLVDAPECKRGAPHRWRLYPSETEGHLDLTLVFAFDPLEPLNPSKAFKERVEQKVKLYLVGCQPPNSKSMRIEGWVTCQPKTRDITIIADKAEACGDEASEFKVGEEDRRLWMRYFMGREPEKLLNQVAPTMVGRPLAQEALLLMLHSVAVIPDVYGQPIRGCLRVLFYGDTKTHKSRSGKDLTIDHYGLGDYVVGETSSRAGLTYTIDSENRVLIWGALPLNDLGLVVIDGLHSIHKEEWREFREALETMRVIVRRMVSGEALARVRILGIFNPGMRQHKPLSAYLYPCEALQDTWIFSDPPDVTRWDVFIPFSTGDVPKSLVTRARPKERPVPDEVFLRHVMWAWSRRPDQIHYMEGAKRLIEDRAERLIEAYSLDTVPIVHLGYRDVITRISVAYATLMHSVDDSHENIVVKAEHVEKAIAFLKKMIEALELKKYKNEVEGKREITTLEAEEIIADLDEEAIAILNALKSGHKTSDELAELLGVSPKTIKRRYGTLRRHGLIKTTTGKGVELSIRGINFVKAYLCRDIRDMGTKSVPNHPPLGTENVPMPPEFNIPLSENLSCPYCSKAYNSEDELEKHITALHTGWPLSPSQEPVSENKGASLKTVQRLNQLNGDKRTGRLSVFKHPLDEAIYKVLKRHGGEVGILRLQMELEKMIELGRKDLDLSKLNKCLRALEYRGCILRLGETIKIGPKWEGDE
ncbi:Rrf2 family transcriptional regulator [Candidatus Bathyarchaeota archaeon]|nr:Rrf2 family transcriptional regulator [Candidatus Bathyarchaeota archaeon]